MKKLHKISALLLALSLLFLTACGPKEKPVKPYVSGDMIVLAGKGHEDYQEIKGVKHHMDERELIYNALHLVQKKL